MPSQVALLALTRTWNESEGTVPKVAFRRRRTESIGLAAEGPMYRLSMLCRDEQGTKKQGQTQTPPPFGMKNPGCQNMKRVAAVLAPSGTATVTCRDVVELEARKREAYVSPPSLEYMTTRLSRSLVAGEH